MKNIGVAILILYSIVYKVIGCPEENTACYRRMSYDCDDSENLPQWTYKYHYCTDQCADTAIPEPDLEATTTENYEGNFEPEEDNPCLPYKPELPDFSKPGRRISETKCFEYIWYLNQRLEKINRTKACDAYVMRTSREPIAKVQILGGRVTGKGEFPHMGAIAWRGVTDDEPWLFKCGGALISTKFVLTAGHCTKASSRDTSIADVRPQIIRFGAENIRQSFPFPRDIKIKRIIPHPKYKPPKKYFDIALMELDEEITPRIEVQPGCLWTDPKITVKEATVTGWGVTNVATQETSAELQAATLDIIDTETCNKLLEPGCNRHWCGLQDHQFCAGKLEGGIDSCQGDSGGPIQVPIPLPSIEEGSLHKILGVVSFGIGCGKENMPGVYVSVASVIDWIEETVWGNNLGN